MTMINKYGYSRASQTLEPYDVEREKDLVEREAEKFWIENFGIEEEGFFEEGSFDEYL